MAKDPAFLFYPADASEDTQFLNRLERGCYFDILKAQKKFNRFSIEVLKKVLGKDFELCWPALEPVLKKDDSGFFIEWADDAIEKRKVFTESRRKNRSKADNNSLFIYLMKDEDSGHYKIGSSVNPTRRIIEMQTRMPNIKLLYSFGATNQKTESYFHNLFKDKQIVNEFYELDENDIFDMIEHMCVHMKLHMIKHMSHHMTSHIDHMISHMIPHINEHMDEHMVNGNGNVFNNKSKEGVSNNMRGGVGEENFGEEKGKEVKIPESVLSGNKGINFGYTSEEFKEMWKQWRIYLFLEHQKEYKSLSSEQAAIMHLVQLASSDENLSIEIIKYSMANAWKSLNKPDNNSNNGTAKPGQRPAGKNGKPDYSALKQKLAADMERLSGNGG